MDKSTARAVTGFICLLLWPVKTWVYGLAGRDIWNWFVVTAFDVPKLSVVQVIGIGMAIGFFQPRLALLTLNRMAKHDKDMSNATFFSNWFYTLVAWGVSAIFYHNFVK